MFVKIHLNPRASEGPTNMIFLRYLSLDFRQQHTNLVDHSVKPVFFKTLLLLDEPNQCDPKYSFKKSCIPSKTVKDPDQQLPGDVDTILLAWKRAPIRPYFGSSSKAAPCLQIDDKVFLEFDRQSQPL